MSRGVKVGDKFGKLTVEKVLGKRSVCRCECGKRRTIYNCNLLAKRNTSCGKCSHFGTNHRLEGLPVGYRSGKLVVIGPDPTVKRCKDSRTICKCDCGRVISVITSLLRPSSSARQYSCGHDKRLGCYKNGASAVKGVPRSHIRLGNIWRGMKSRCFNRKNASYMDYGGRGITVCDEWVDNFFAFRDWALNNGYSDDLSLDRIDNSRGYSPENCRWATREQQQINRRNPVKNSVVLELRDELSRLLKQNCDLKDEVKRLKERIAQYEKSKDSEGGRAADPGPADAPGAA